MKQRIQIGIGCACLFIGWLGSFILNSLASGYEIYVLAPTLMIAFGLGLIWRTRGGKIAALSLAFTALLAVLTMNQLYPGRALSIPAIKKRFQTTAEEGRRIPVLVPESLRTQVIEQDRHLSVYADIEVSLYAQLPGTPADMVFTDSGQLFVSIPNLGAIYILTPAGTTAPAPGASLYFVGLDRPSGVLYRDHTLYVAEPGGIVGLRDLNNDQVADHVLEILDNLPDDGGHWRRYLAATSDDTALYVSIGSRCDACEEPDPRRGSILKVFPATGKADIFASGLRNVGGFYFQDHRQQLWVTENGRVGNGAAPAADEINIVKAGGDYGWPYCVGANRVERGLGTAERCSQALPSVVDLPPGSQPAGLISGVGLSAPDSYRHSLYVVLTEGINGGYGRIIRIPFNGDSLEKEALEFVKADGQGSFAWTPGQIRTGPDGDLYVSDEATNAIYRIHWRQ